MLQPAAFSVELKDVTVLGKSLELNICLFNLRNEVCVDIFKECELQPFEMSFEQGVVVPKGLVK